MPPAKAGASVPSPFAGFDRRNYPELDAKNSHWMEEMFENSNFYFTGCYVTGPALSGHSNREFTGPSRLSETKWTAHAKDIESKGWGIAFFYLGYSQNHRATVNMPADFDDDAAKDAGTLHAQHIKTIVSNMGSDMAGSVVIIDNEDSQLSQNLKPVLWTYYNALFAEMALPGPEKIPAVRPGLYAHLDIAARMLQDVPDLFIWATDVVNPDPRKALWNEPDKTVEMELRPFPIRQIQFQQKRQRTGIPLGRQAVIDYTTTSLPKRRLSQYLVRVSSWDFDMSFVRDPRYPIANPRICNHAGLRVRGTYLKDTKSMTVEEIQNPDTKPLDGAVIEPEAPIILTPVLDLFTIDTDGNIVTSHRDSPQTWSPLVALPTAVSPPILRRLRAMTVAFRPAAPRRAQETQVFFVADDGQLIARRRVGKNPWTDAAVMADGVTVHPFGDLTSASRNPDRVDVFFIDSEGILKNASWTPTRKGWPGDYYDSLQDAATILPGTRLAAAAPTAKDILVFAIGKDLRLSVVVFSVDDGWGKVTPVGKPTDSLFAHSRLATVTTPTTVRVAAISEQGDPCVYEFQLQNDSWAFQKRVVYSHVAVPVPDIYNLPSPEDDQPPDPKYWGINPFGDISLSSPGGATILSCAATFPGTSAILQKKLGSREPWSVLYS